VLADNYDLVPFNTAAQDILVGLTLEEASEV
jgi:hypothetical protein